VHDQRIGDCRTWHLQVFARSAVGDVPDFRRLEPEGVKFLGREFPMGQAISLSRLRRDGGLSVALAQRRRKSLFALVSAARREMRVLPVAVLRAVFHAQTTES
jgi:hypothetical protein